ncbi:MAG: tRNA lysidine(34) synthetase TilS [Bacteroidota bacterium]|nr:tRNA lysidine(34) synthetase TilS [Bacteroidota bacterium]MDP4234218.1 tRNA lysidine(34) synthetase TilS [Bacteroidota bacterium]MDP4243408.1 tRNA lysidine(34) synthetase TilS [Bacteroidota bacterium]MDP4288107.1 tRNA lysidine(34) synthetase TilS [Bacteroidota bacterium]
MSHVLPAIVARTGAILQSLSVTSDSSVIVGVSGGPDSVALAHVMLQLKLRGRVGEVFLAHINHGLRGSASDADQTLVSQHAKEWNLPNAIWQADTTARAREERKGIEETARNIRYEFFEELAVRHGAQFILTAHTANDQAETVIMHAVRGAGVRGLAGIPQMRKLGALSIIRPWLGVTRDEIEEYLLDQKLRFNRDESNEELNYQRNRIRHTVIPALIEAYPDRSPVRALAGLAHRMAKLDNFLASLTQENLEMLLQPDGSINLSGLRNLQGFLLHGVVEAWVNLKIGCYRLTEIETRKIERFLASTSRRTELRNGVSLLKKKDAVLIFCKTQ